MVETLNGNARARVFVHMQNIPTRSRCVVVLDVLHSRVHASSYFTFFHSQIPLLPLHHYVSADITASNLHFNSAELGFNQN